MVCCECSCSATLREKPSNGKNPMTMHLVLTMTAPLVASEAMRSTGLGNQRNMYTYGGGKGEGGKGEGGKGGKGGKGGQGSSDENPDAADEQGQWEQWHRRP